MHMTQQTLKKKGVCAEVSIVFHVQLTTDSANVLTEKTDSRERETSVSFTMNFILQNGVKLQETVTET